MVVALIKHLSSKLDSLRVIRHIGQKPAVPAFFSEETRPSEASPALTNLVQDKILRIIDEVQATNLIMLPN